MNPQIEKLAMNYANKMGNSVLHNADHLEKFAALIIEECVDYAFANGDNVDYLKQHFGVDE